MYNFGLEIDPADEFEDLASRIVNLPAPQSPASTTDVENWSFSEAVTFLALNMLGDPLLRTAAKKVFTDNWLVRRATGSLADLLVTGS